MCIREKIRLEEITRETEHQSLQQQLKGKENQQNYQENTEYITLSARTNKGPNVSTTCSIPANQDKTNDSDPVKESIRQKG